jgi:CBS domain-containing protein
MPIGNFCVREVAVATPETTVHQAARLMRQMHVGNLIVVDDTRERRRPIGIVTDRDIVLSVVATGLDPNVFTLGDVAMKELVTCQEDDGVFECIQRMRLHGVRRMPVLDHEGQLVGIVSADDLVELLAEELGEIGKLIAREQAEEAHTRR